MHPLRNFLDNPKITFHNYLFRMGFRYPSYKEWESRQYAAPSPHFIKLACLIRNSIPSATWVETGTYLGDTTEKLASVGNIVYSIEPESNLFENAKNRFRNWESVHIIKGVSECVLPKLLPGLSGDVCFWLDGHFSGGITYKGDQTTPILDELSCISEHMSHMDRVVIMIDDARCFSKITERDANYPPLDYLVEWARHNGCSWHIEHDIFFAKNY